MSKSYTMGDIIYNVDPPTGDTEYEGFEKAESHFDDIKEWFKDVDSGKCPTYDATLDYTVGAEIMYNGSKYSCIQANGASSTVHAPTDTSYWLKIFDSDGKLAIGALPVSAEFQAFTPTLLQGGSGYTTASGGFYYAQYGAWVQVSWALWNFKVVNPTAYELEFSLPKTISGTGAPRFVGSQGFLSPALVHDSASVGIIPCVIKTLSTSKLVWLGKYEATGVTDDAALLGTDYTDGNGYFLQGSVLYMTDEE